MQKVFVVIRVLQTQVAGCDDIVSKCAKACDGRKADIVIGINGGHWG